MFERRVLLVLSVSGLLAFAMLVAAPIGDANGARFNTVLDVGDKAPAWENLPGTDGKLHRLSDYTKSNKGVVVVFTCNSCPVARAYEGRLNQMASQYGPRQIATVAINVNDGETLEAMKKRAEEAGFQFAYLRDESQQTGRQYGATCTPHVFLLAPDRTVVYMGAIDDSWNDPEGVEKPYLRDAIEALLDGKQPEVSETRQQGCQIRYRVQ